MAELKQAAYCGTRNLYGDMETAAKSLIANSDVGLVWLIIEDDEFPAELPDIVRTVSVADQPWFREDGPNYATRFTYMTMVRAALCHVLPDTRKVLSLDCDTICIADASGAWDVDIEGAYFAATPETWADRPGLFYTNVGVSLYNLEKLRDGKADEVIEVLNRHKFGWPEQDALNYLCQGRIAKMPAVYNWNPWVAREGEKHPRIIHYAARDDWRDEPPVLKYRRMPWREVMDMHGQR